jgi:hypothetical protein
MYKKDYLQRQLEEFGMVMAVLFGLRKNKDLTAYNKELALAFTKYSPFTPEQLEPLAREDFIDQLNVQFGSNTKALHMLADLLYEKLNFYLETEETEKAKGLRIKCLYLYALLQENLSENEFNLDIHYRLNFLEALETSL